MAAYPSASFYYPSFSSVASTPPVFNVLDSVNVSWSSTFPDHGVILYLYCTKPGADSLGNPATPPNVPPNVFPTASYAVNLTQAMTGLFIDPYVFTSCHFRLRLTGDVDQDQSSHPTNNSERFDLDRNKSHQPITWGLDMTVSSSSFSLSSISHTKSPLTTSSPTISSLTTSSPTISSLTTSTLTTSSINTVVASNSYATSSSVITASSAVAPSASSSSNTGSAPISQHRVNSTIAVVGITVGITLALVGLLIVLGILLRRLRAKKAAIGILKTTALRPREDVNAIEMEGDFVPIELSATERVPELDGTPLNELQGCEPLE